MFERHEPHGSNHGARTTVPSFQGHEPSYRRTRHVKSSDLWPVGTITPTQSLGRPNRERQSFGPVPQMTRQARSEPRRRRHRTCLSFGHCSGDLTESCHEVMVVHSFDRSRRAAWLHCVLVDGCGNLPSVVVRINGIAREVRWQDTGPGPALSRVR